MGELGIVAARQRAAALTTNQGRGLCGNCVKPKGVAILPAVSSVLPKALRTAADRSGTRLPGGLEQEVGEVVRALDRAMANGADLSHHWRFLRALPPGYLYVLKENGTFDAYLSDASGLLRKLPAAGMPNRPEDVDPLDISCSREEHNNLALQFIVLNPEEDKKVWIAFSRDRWTESVLTTYAANVDGCRDQRMREVDVVKVAEGALGRGKAVPYGMPMRPDLGRFIADYAPIDTRIKLNEYLLEPLYARGATPPLFPMAPKASDDGQAEKLAEEMARISAQTPAGTGAVLLLDDAVGVVTQLNWERNRCVEDLLEATGAGDAERARRRVIADIIEGIRINADANPGPFYDRNYGPDRFLKHIDQTAWQEARAESARERALKQALEQISEDYCAAIGQGRWAVIQRYDYDPDCDVSAMAHREMICHCVGGSGITQQERESVWLPVLIDMAADDKDNWFSRALSALHPGLQAYFVENDQVDKEVDAVAHITRLAQVLSGAGVETLSRLRNQIALNRKANEATAVLVETVAANLLALRRQNLTAFNALVRRVATAFLVYSDVSLEAVNVRGATESLFRLFVDDVFSKPAQTTVIATGSAPVRNAHAANGRFDPGRYFQDHSDNHLGQAGRRVSRQAGRAVVARGASRNHSLNEMRAIAAWVVGRLQAGMEPNVKLTQAELRRAGLLNIADPSAPVPTAQANPITMTRVARASAGTDMVLGSAALFFHAINIANGAQTLLESDASWTERGDGVVAVAAGLLGSYSAVTTSWAAARELAGRQTAVGRAAAIKTSARFSAHASFVEGGWLIIKGLERYHSGDTESGGWFFGSGAFLVASGLAGLKAGSALVAVGAGAGVVPVVGWTLAVIALVGAATWMGIQAFSTSKDNMLLLEYWLDNGAFGLRQQISHKGNPFRDEDVNALSFESLSDELTALYQITLGPQIECTTHRTSRHDRNSVMWNYQVDIPRYGPGSRVAIVVRGDGGEGEPQQVALYEGGSTEAQFWEDEEADFFTYASALPNATADQETSNLRISHRFFIRRNQMPQRGQEPRTLRLSLEIHYWPDAEGMQALRIIKVANWRSREVGVQRTRR